MLNDRLMQGGEQHVILRVDLWLRHHEQSMVFSGIATNDGGARVGPRSIGPNNFPL